MQKHLVRLFGLGDVAFGYLDFLNPMELQKGQKLF